MLVMRHGVLGGPRPKTVARKINPARVHRTSLPVQVKQEDEPNVINITIEIKPDDEGQLVQEVVSNVEFYVSEVEQKPEEEVLVEEKKTKKKKAKKG